VADIVAFNMNPTLDLTTSAERIAPTSKVRCEPVHYEPGGGGINVARVARILGADAVTIFPAGGYTGQVLCALLEQLALPHRCLPISGRTRLSLTVDEASSGEQFRFVFPGPTLSEAEQRNCLDALAVAIEEARIVVATGSLPPGVRTDFFQSIADMVRKSGKRFILDTSGEALRKMTGRVHVLKPSERELQDCVGRELRTVHEQVEAARELIARGVSETVVVSLGARGVLLVTAESHETFPALDVPVRSAVGAGDSMVAGIAVGLLRGYDLRAALCLGTAAGAATVLRPGSELGHREDVDRFFADLSQVNE
jgi:6-phosphofructokinase 2